MNSSWIAEKCRRPEPDCAQLRDFALISVVAGIALWSLTSATLVDTLGAGCATFLLLATAAASRFWSGADELAGAGPASSLPDIPTTTAHCR